MVVVVVVIMGMIIVMVMVLIMVAVVVCIVFWYLCVIFFFVVWEKTVKSARAHLLFFPSFPFLFLTCIPKTFLLNLL